VGVLKHEPPTPDQVFVVAALRLRWPDGDLEELSDMRAPGYLAEEFGAWLSTVRDWLAAWSGNLRETVFLQPTPAMRLAPVRAPTRARWALAGRTRR
jgi:hypothetical protein